MCYVVRHKNYLTILDKCTHLHNTDGQYIIVLEGGWLVLFGLTALCILVKVIVDTFAQPCVAERVFVRTSVVTNALCIQLSVIVCEYCKLYIQRITISSIFRSPIFICIYIVLEQSEARIGNH